VSSVQIVGHRGARDEAPENTVEGFAYARGIGLAAVEFDVRLSADRELVVIHDNTVDRTTSASGPVSNFTATQLASLDARRTCPTWPEQVGVPTLDQVLDVLSDIPTMQIEFKSDTPERLEEIAVGVLQRVRVRSLGAQAILTSFDPVALEIIQRLAPEQARAYINRYEEPDALETALRLGCSQVNVFQMTAGSAMPDVVQHAREAGLRVGGGPCNSREQLDRVLEMGVDASTSDVPSKILELLSVA